MRALLALFILVASSTTGWASQWVAFGEGGEGQFAIAIDLDSIQRQGSRVTVWERFSYNQPVKHTGGRFIHVIKSHQSYDCDRRSTLLLHGFAYGDVNATVALDTIRYSDRPSNYSAVATRSVEERILDQVCSNALAIR